MPRPEKGGEMGKKKPRKSEEGKIHRCVTCGEVNSKD